MEEDFGGHWTVSCSRAARGVGVSRFVELEGSAYVQAFLNDVPLLAMQL